MASQNFFDSASEITVALKYIPQFASRPAATGYAAGSLLFDANDNAFYKVVNGACAVVPFLTTVGSLSDINDVDASGVLDGQPLTYDASTSTWKGGAFSIASLNDVGDVNVAGVTGNQILYFDSGTSTWKAQAFSTQETYSSASDLTADLNSVYAALTGATFTGGVSAASVSSSGLVTASSVVINDAGNIGSVSDPDAMSIAATGDVTLTQDLSVLGSVDVSGTLATNTFSVTTLSATTISANSAGIFSLGSADVTTISLTVSGSATVDSLKVINAGTIGSVGDPDAMAISATGDVSLTQDLSVAGAAVVSGSVTASDVVVGNDGNIGSAGDTDAIAIASNGLVTFSAGTKGVTESFIIACSDESTALTTGTAKVTFRMPYAFTLQAVRASVTTAPVGSTIIVDINEGGTTILSTKLSIDASEKTSTTAAVPPVISDSALADDAEITIDIDQVGSGTAGAGLKVALIGVRA